MTDYAGFTQWRLVTYRVWQCFFFFVEPAVRSRPARRAPEALALLTVLNYAGLCYFELVFAVFVALFCGTFTAGDALLEQMTAFFNKHRPR